MDEDKGYEVIDKRGTGEEAEPEQPSAEEPEPTQQAEPETGGQEQPQAVADVYSMLGLFAAMLAENAWVWMGLRVNPGTGKIEKDLEQARIAIDALVYITDQIGRKAE